MNVRTHYDLVAIGSGATGRHGALQRAKLGELVAGIQQPAIAGGGAIGVEYASIAAELEAGVTLIECRQGNTGSLEFSAAGSCGRIRPTRHLRCRRCHQGAQLW
jgi:pyruvate/2-oxoglutarate dehydrogenase complex dihydrolipoamide dehydrogenase (E3) component